MRVKIQLLRDADGAVLYEHVGDAFAPGGYDAPPSSHFFEAGQELCGFTYLPLPPPRAPFDAAEFRRLYAALGGAGL